MRHSLLTIATIAALATAAGCDGGHSAATPFDTNASATVSPDQPYLTSYAELLDSGLNFVPTTLHSAMQEGLTGHRLISTVNDAISRDEDAVVWVGVIEQGIATCFISHGRYFQILHPDAADETYVLGAGNCSKDVTAARHVLRSQPAANGYPSLFKAVTTSNQSKLLAARVNDRIIEAVNDRRSAPSLRHDSKAIYAALMAYRSDHGEFPRSANPAATMRILEPYGARLTHRNSLAYLRVNTNFKPAEFDVCVESPLKHFVFINLGADGAIDRSDAFDSLPGTCADMG